MVVVAPEGQVPEAPSGVHFRVPVEQAIGLPFFGALESAMGQEITTRIGTCRGEGVSGDGSGQ